MTFKCAKASEMHFQNLADRTRYLKENPKGVSEMCKVMDELRKETELQIAKNFLMLNKLTHEEIAQATGLTLEEIKNLAGQAAS